MDGRLGPRDAARVYAHLQDCHVCQERLTAYERLSQSLRLNLGRAPQASRADVNRWWGNISSAKMQVPKPNRVYVFAPALLIAVVVSLPLVTALATFSPASMRAQQVVQNTTASVPAATQPFDDGMIPHIDESTQGVLAVSTAAPLDDTVTAAPAPLAPATDR
jgi:hypothetical protein